MDKMKSKLRGIIYCKEKPSHSSAITVVFIGSKRSNRPFSWLWKANSSTPDSTGPFPVSKRPTASGKTSSKPVSHLYFNSFIVSHNIYNQQLNKFGVDILTEIRNPFQHESEQYWQKHSDSAIFLGL